MKSEISPPTDSSPRWTRMQTFRVIVTIVLLTALLIALWQRDPFPLDPVAFLGVETEIPAR